jgi:hypothetical protein
MLLLTLEAKPIENMSIKPLIYIVNFKKNAVPLQSTINCNDITEIVKHPAYP